MIKCIAIDDEPHALRQLAEYIEAVPYLSLEGSFESAFDACNFLHDNAIDLIFVDINMPDINGIDFVKSLSKNVKIVFITAHSEFAYEGFQLDAADYLLKPISFTDFLKSANKVNERYFQQNSSLPEIQQNRDYLFIKSEYRVIRINFKDIKYIESKREYVKIFLDGSEPITTLMSIKKLEETLPGNMFMRVHRSFIVNLDKITVVERNRIIFDNKVYIPISENYGEKFQEYMEKGFV
ncbi:LytTr DNA-binding domain protein [Phocaeicola plebeius DSM 17135]|uniref:LytTr DNA-binding domain protein n=1 Tax=Phocaeicola plebeius (strain DSM 17135 / JCM 12973 / CCUG 54634 / M2) TaxID=484018 RepID=B5CZ84_PHOPM|nr:LytTR family DNA-binding domain-containing protein [Phocaeicola plebeius]EDY95765.1 LytTr DNA-binding domain protein [Phocaeicola plebeius DSM 17135]